MIYVHRYILHVPRTAHTTLQLTDLWPLRETEPQANGSSSASPPSTARRLFNRLCGVEAPSGEAPPNPRDRLTEEQRAEEDAASLYEDPKQRV